MWGEDRKSGLVPYLSRMRQSQIHPDTSFKLAGQASGVEGIVFDCRGLQWRLRAFVAMWLETADQVMGENLPDPTAIKIVC